MKARHVHILQRIGTQVLLLGIATWLYVIRQFESFSNPQLYAEDSVWLTHAYDYHNLVPFFISDGGYLQTLSRIVGAAASAVPLEYAPHVFIYSSLLIRLILFMVIVSKRNNVLPGIQKYILAYGCIVMQNTREIHINFNYSQWYLALAAMFVLLYKKPTKRARIWFDLMLITLSSFSGPFVFVFFPLLLLQRFIYKDKSSGIYVWITGVACVIQAYYLFLSPRGTVHFPSLLPMVAYAIVRNHVMVGAIISEHIYRSIFYINAAFAGAMGYAIVTIGVIIVAYSFIRMGRSMKMLILFGLGVFILSMGNSTSADDWRSLVYTAGVRYWYIPSVVYIACVIRVAFDEYASSIVRTFSFIVIMLFFITLQFDTYNFFYYPLEDLHWKKHIRVFNTVKTGEQYTIPINPRGWNVTLMKK